MNIKERVSSWQARVKGDGLFLTAWDLAAVEAELERLWRVEECANEVEQLERELADAQAEIARLRAAPRPPEPMGMTAQKLQWNSDVQHYESLLREQK